MDRRLPAALGVLCFAALLGGCVETGTPGPQALAPDVPGAIAHGEMRSPRGAALALASLEGAPDPLLTRLRQSLAGEAERRQMTLSDAAGARYVLRGYLDAYPTETGTSVRYVWDLFDADRQRSRRIDDGFELPAAAGPDPWAGVDDAALTAIAARSTDAMATFLSGTPEALAGGAPTAPPAVN